MTEDLNAYSHLWPDRIDEISTKLDAARDAALALPLRTNVPDCRNPDMTKGLPPAFPLAEGPLLSG